MCEPEVIKLRFVQALANFVASSASCVLGKHSPTSPSTVIPHVPLTTRGGVRADTLVKSDLDGIQIVLPLAPSSAMLLRQSLFRGAAES